METKTSSQLGVFGTIRYVANNQEATVQIDRLPYLIGRDSSSVQLALPDATVSRTHARLICQDGTVLLENISATNKTAVNGKFIDGPVPLNTGDQAIMGACKLFFEIFEQQPWDKQNAETEQSIAEEVSGAMATSEQGVGDKSISEGPAPEELVSEEPAPQEPPPQEPASEQPIQNDAPESEARYCRQCGVTLSAGTAFCGKCGTAVSTEITGRPMFCASCGKKVGQDFQFCPQCGKPTEQGKLRQNVSPTVSASKPGLAAAEKRKKGFWGRIVAVLMVVVAVAAIFFFGGRSYKTVVKQYIDATFDGDFVKIWKLLPEEIQDQALSSLGIYGIDDISDITDVLGNDFGDAFLFAEFEYGKDFKYSYEITDEKDFSKAEVNLLEKAVQAIGVRDIEINAAKALEVELTIKPTNGEEYQQTIAIDVAKVGRSWHLFSLGH